jgi:MoaA/NifB/PqqE/SkfB family radical SAM enzyme
MKICDRPFKHLHIYPNGNVKVCSWTTQVIGNIIDNELEDIWNGEKAQKIRESIHNGSFEFCPKVGCPFCENDSLPDITEDEFLTRAIKQDLPVSINAAFDYRCNHSCPSCRSKIYNPTKNDLENIKRMVDLLVPVINKGEFLSTNGNGDLFASPDIMDMLSHIQPENPEFKITLETNGVLFTKSNWDKIKHLGKYYIKLIVTPNSFESDTYQILAGGHNNLDKLIENLHFIKELREKNIINEFVVSIVMQDLNFMELPRYVTRCLQEFNVDQVTIKPIYKWFKMTEENYWFKDVLNPKHPYHNEYLEMRKHPIFQDERVYWWGAENIHEPKEHPSKIFKTYLSFFAKLIGISNSASKIYDYLNSKGFNRVALYGLGPHTELLYNLLKETDLQMPCILYNRYYANCDFGVRMTSINDIDQEDIDAIIVVNYPFYNDLKENFDFKGINLELIPLDKIVEAIS